MAVPIAILPGLLSALALTGAAVFLSDLIGDRVLHASPSPISPITVAIVLGILAGNTLGVSKRLSVGLDFCIKKLLRLGIILIGLKLSLRDVAELGALGVPVVLAVIAGGLWF